MLQLWLECPLYGGLSKLYLSYPTKPLCILFTPFLILFTPFLNLVSSCLHLSGVWIVLTPQTETTTYVVSLSGTIWWQDKCIGEVLFGSTHMFVWFMVSWTDATDATGGSLTWRPLLTVLPLLNIIISHYLSSFEPLYPLVDSSHTFQLSSLFWTLSYSITYPCLNICILLSGVWSVQLSHLSAVFHLLNIHVSHQYLSLSAAKRILTPRTGLPSGNGNADNSWS